MIQAGTTLQQRYRIDKQIGQGGMGFVYVATDERFGSTVAIKETLCMDDNFRKALDREARLLNSLKHSALPRVSDHFLESEGQFLVMEFIQGEDLCNMLEKRGAPFDVEQVLKWADQLLDALDYLHNQNVPVVHRDIKPQNLKITSGGQIILLDFGLAKGNPTDANQNTAAKSIFGYSRNYASLEQIQGTGTDPRSDLYSLAATLYHLLTNTPPEDALTRAMSVLSQKPDPLIPANAVNPKIPRGVAGVLQKALDLNADSRPSSAMEMREMFRESEKYAYLADTAAVSTAATDTSLFAQPTKLMSDRTKADEIQQTDIKTELFPEFISEETSVSPGKVATHRRAVVSIPDSASTQTEKRRGLPVALVTFLIFLVGVVIAGGIYVFKPSIFGMTKSDEKTGAPFPVANTSAAQNTNVETAQTNTAPRTNSESSNSQNPEIIHPSEKTTETAKTNKGQGKPKTDSGERVDIAGDPEDPDDVTITQRDKNGKVTTTRINPNVQPMNVPIPPIEGFDPFPNGVPSGALTPAQLRRLQLKLKNLQRRQIPTTPDDPQ
jgi:serine/threonine protein kinase